MFLLGKVWHEYDKWKTKKKELLVNTIIINAAAQLDTTESINNEYDSTSDMLDFDFNNFVVDDDDGSDLLVQRGSRQSCNSARRGSSQQHNTACVTLIRNLAIL